MSELTAALATIEKLRAERDQLAAENVALKESVEHAAGCISAAEAEGLIDALAETTDERLAGLVHRRLCHAYLEVKTPATDRIVAAQRSAFVDEAVAKITESGALTFGDCIVALCQLREGAK